MDLKKIAEDYRRAVASAKARGLKFKGTSGKCLLQLDAAPQNLFERPLVAGSAG